MEKDVTHPTNNNKNEEAWDKFSFAYYSALNSSTLCLMSTLMALTKVHKMYTVLDAGCGPGLGTKLITSMIPNQNSTVYALDFSDEMMKLSEKVFDEYADFKSNKENHLEVRTSYDAKNKLIVEEDTAEIRKHKIGKVVKLFQGNVEQLPFADEQFDAYLSNLCLMCCENPDKAIAEAFRVLKYQGAAAFSIWGNSLDSKFIWTIFLEAFKKQNLDFSKEKTSFWLGEDQAALRERFIKAGFKDIRIERTTIIYDCFDEQDFLVKFQGPKINNLLRHIQDDKIVKAVLEDVKIEAKKHVVDLKQLPTLDALIIVAFK